MRELCKNYWNSPISQYRGKVYCTARNNNDQLLCTVTHAKYRDCQKLHSSVSGVKVICSVLKGNNSVSSDCDTLSPEFFFFFCALTELYKTSTSKYDASCMIWRKTNLECRRPRRTHGCYQNTLILICTVVFCCMSCRTAVLSSGRRLSMLCTAGCVRVTVWYRTRTWRRLCVLACERGADLFHGGIWSLTLISLYTRSSWQCSGYPSSCSRSSTFGCEWLSCVWCVLVVLWMNQNHVAALACRGATHKTKQKCWKKYRAAVLPRVL